MLAEIVERLEMQQGVDGCCPRFAPGGGDCIELCREMEHNLLPPQALRLVEMCAHRGLLESQEVGRPGGPAHDLVSLEAHLYEIVDSAPEGTLADGMDLEQGEDDLHLTCGRSRNEGVDVLEVPAHGFRGQAAPKGNLG